MVCHSQLLLRDLTNFNEGEYQNQLLQNKNWSRLKSPKAASSAFELLLRKSLGAVVCQGDEEGVYWNQLLQRGSLNFYKREPGQGTKTNLKLTTFKKGAYRNHSKTKRFNFYKGAYQNQLLRNKNRSQLKWAESSHSQPPRCFAQDPLLRKSLVWQDDKERGELEPTFTKSLTKINLN